jgi:hypothetical protein
MLNHPVEHRSLCRRTQGVFRCLTSIRLTV